MSYDIDLLVSTDREVPNQEQLKQAIRSMPMIEEGKPPKGYIWQFDYLNPDTTVTFAFRYQEPPTSCIKQKAWDTGLQLSIPTTCPTFVARESCPVVAEFAKRFQFWLYLPNGDILEHCDASQLQRNWTDINRRTITRLSSQPASSQPFYFPQEKLDEMWRYLSSRPALLKRYTPQKVYVPRMLLQRNKLNRKMVFRTAMWTDLQPSVIPDVDAFIINKPAKLTFGMFPSSPYTPVFVRRETIEEIIAPYIRKATRPIPHDIIENTKHIKLPIYKLLSDMLTIAMRDYETVYVEEVVDVALS